MNASDKLAIHELLSRAAYAFDERNLDMLEQCFTPDASMLVNIADGTTYGPFDGREAIMGLLKGALDAQTDTRRHVAADGVQICHCMVEGIISCNTLVEVEASVTIIHIDISVISSSITNNNV